jgi:hypothetical protein
LGQLESKASSGAVLVKKGLCSPLTSHHLPKSNYIQVDDKGQKLNILQLFMRPS